MKRLLEAALAAAILGLGAFFAREWLARRSAARLTREQAASRPGTDVPADPARAAKPRRAPAADWMPPVRLSSPPKKSRPKPAIPAPGR